jgi:hypothetical protein
VFSANDLVKGILVLTAAAVLVPWALVGPAVSPSLTPPPPRRPSVDPVSVRECGATRGLKFYTKFNEPRSLLCEDAYELTHYAATHGYVYRPRFCYASWLVEEATLCTRNQTQIVGLAYLGDLKVGKLHGEGYGVVDPRWNCHGDTFAGGFFAVNPDQVDTILANEFGAIDRSLLQPGDIVVYRTADRVPIHSTTLFRDSSDGQLKTYGKRGILPMDEEKMLPIGPGPGAAWGNPGEAPARAEFYRRKP